MLSVAALWPAGSEVPPAQAGGTRVSCLCLIPRCLCLGGAGACGGQPFFGFVTFSSVETASKAGLFSNHPRVLRARLWYYLSGVVVRPRPLCTLYRALEPRRHL